MFHKHVAMTSKECFLVLDIGTHAVRAALVHHHPTQSPQILFLSKKIYALSRLSSSQVEQDADDILSQTRLVLSDALQKANKDDINIVSAGIAIQRSTVVAWTASGESLHPALSWQDTRGQSTVETLKADSKIKSRIKSISGLPLSPHYGATKISWLHKHLSEHDAVYCGPLVSFLLFNLLATRPYICDESNVGRTQLYDIRARDWSSELCTIFAVNIKGLPKVVPVEFDYGDLDVSFHDSAQSYSRNIPLRIVCGDQNSAYQYMSWVSRQGACPESRVMPECRAIAINSGSGAFVLTDDKRNNKTPQSLPDKKASKNLDQPFLQSLVFSDLSQTQYVLEGTVNGVGTALTWMCEHWLSLGVSNETSKSENARSEKIFFQKLDVWCENPKPKYVFLNTVGGIGSPYWLSGSEPKFYSVETLEKYFTRGSSVKGLDVKGLGVKGLDVNGFSPEKIGSELFRTDFDDATIGDACVAVIESIIFLIAVNVEGILSTQHNGDNETGDHAINTIVIGGGVSRSNYLCQGLSDVLNIRVRRIADHDATALGVAVMLRASALREKQVSNQGEAPVDITLDEFYPKKDERSMHSYLVNHYAYFKKLLNTLL